MKNKFDYENDDFGAILNCAVRYALGRRTYMVSIVIEYIMPILSQVSDRTIRCFSRDLDDRHKDGLSFGDDCDVAQWQMFEKAVKREMALRNIQ